MLALGGGASARRRSARRSPAHAWSGSTSTSGDRLGAGRRAAAVRWRATAASVRAALRRARAAVRGARRRDRPGRALARAIARGAGRARGAADARAKLLWAASAVGRLPGLRRAGAAAEHRVLAARRSRAGGSWSPTATSGRLYGELLEPALGRVSRSCPASSRRPSPTPRSSGPSWRGRGDPRRRRRRARRRSGRRPRRLLRRHLPARACASCRCRPRWSRRSTPPTAARPASTCAEAKNYVGAYHQPAAVIADTDDARDAPAGGARGRLRRGRQDGADRRRELWERIRGGRRPDDPEVIARVRADEAADRRPGRARRRPAPGAQPRPHGRPRDRDRDRLRALPPRRGGRPRPARRAAPLRAADELRGEVRSCSRRPGLPITLDGTSTSTQVVFATARDKKRVGEGPVPFVLLDAPGGPQYRLHGRAAGELRAAVRELDGVTPIRQQPDRGDARRQPRPARPPRSATTTGSSTLRELERRIAA